MWKGVNLHISSIIDYYRKSKGPSVAISSGPKWRRGLEHNVHSLSAGQGMKRVPGLRALKPRTRASRGQQARALLAEEKGNSLLYTEEDTLQLRVCAIPTKSRDQSSLLERHCRKRASSAEDTLPPRECSCFRNRGVGSCELNERGVRA